jgi:hypothetical protein
MFIIELDSKQIANRVIDWLTASGRRPIASRSLDHRTN